MQLVSMDVEYELSVKRVELNVLEAEMDPDEMWDSEEFQRLQQQIAALEAKLEDDEAAAAGNNQVWESMESSAN